MERIKIIVLSPNVSLIVTMQRTTNEFDTESGEKLSCSLVGLVLVHPDINKFIKISKIKMANDLFSLIIIDKFPIDTN